MILGGLFGHFDETRKTMDSTEMIWISTANMIALINFFLFPVYFLPYSGYLIILTLKIEGHLFRNLSDWKRVDTQVWGE